MAVDAPSQAWTILRRNQGVDLVITELTLPSGNGLDFISQLNADLHPGGFRAIPEHARQHHLPLAETEKLFLGCTTMELAAHFC